jgi:hypothetical protein
LGITSYCSEHPPRSANAIPFELNGRRHRAAAPRLQTTGPLALGWIIASPFPRPCRPGGACGPGGLACEPVGHCGAANSRGRSCIAVTRINRVNQWQRTSPRAEGPTCLPSLACRAWTTGGPIDSADRGRLA